MLVYQGIAKRLEKSGKTTEFRVCYAPRETNSTPQDTRWASLESHDTAKVKLAPRVSMLSKYSSSSSDLQ